MPQCYFYVTFACFLGAQGLYSMALYNLFKEQYVTMSVFSICVGVITMVGWMLYRKFVSLYFDIAHTNLPKESIQPNDKELGTLPDRQNNYLVDGQPRKNDINLNKQIEYDDD